MSRGYPVASVVASFPSLNQGASLRFALPLSASIALDARTKSMGFHCEKDRGNRMPFYLVTQTTLIEADNEQAAAQNAIDRICSGAPVAVAVKFDEATISHITVAAKGETPEPVPLPPENVNSADHCHDSEVVAVHEKSKRAILKRMMGDARSLLSWRA